MYTSVKHHLNYVGDTHMYPCG